MGASGVSTPAHNDRADSATERPTNDEMRSDRSHRTIKLITVRVLAASKPGVGSRAAAALGRSCAEQSLMEFYDSGGWTQLGL
jgi:hypothetical protein